MNGFNIKLSYKIISVILLISVISKLHVCAQSKIGIIDYNKVDSLINLTISENELYADFIFYQDSIYKTNLRFAQKTANEIQRLFQGGCLSPSQAENYQKFFKNLEQEFVDFSEKQKGERAIVRSILFNLINDYLENKVGEIKLTSQVEVLFDSKLIVYSADNVQDITETLMIVFSSNKFINAIGDGETHFRNAIELYTYPRYINISFKDFMNTQKEE